MHGRTIEPGDGANLANVHYYSARLRRKLAKLLKAPVAVIGAPSGYGKTTAVRDFFDALPPGRARVHWCALQGASAEEGWLRLCCALAEIDAAAGARLLAQGFPKRPHVREAVQALRALRCEGETVLVIDDFQRLERKLPRAWLLELYFHRQEKLHVVFLVQTAGASPLPGASGGLRMQAADLALEPEDIRAYYAACGVTVALEEARRLHAYTEGWIAALYLQLLQLRRGGGIEPCADALRLLRETVWSALPARHKRVLYSIAPFECVSAEQLRHVGGVGIGI